MRGSEYGEQDRKASILYEYETFKATEGEQLFDTYLRYVQVINDLNKCGYKKENYELNYKFLNNLQPQWKQYGDVNDALGYKKKAVVVTLDPLALVAEKTKDQAWMESSSDSDQEINANMVFMAQIKKVLSDSDESSSSAEETIAEVAYYTPESESESEYETLEYYDISTNYGLFVNNDDDQEIFYDAIESASENFIENHIDSQKDYDKSEVDHNDSEEKEHLVDKKKIDEQEILFDKMSRQLVEMNNNVLRPQEKILEKEMKISKLEGYVNNKDVEIEKCLERLIECFENPSYFEKAKDLRPSLYDEKVIRLGYTLMFLIHSNEALEIEKFKRARQNKIVNNPDFEKIDSLFQQTSSLKPYVPNVILEKIITDLEDEVVSLLEKEKANLKTIESLKSKGFESSENAISESENQSENDCQVVEKECDQVENSKVIAPGMFKLSVSQSVSPISMTKTSCDSKNVKNLDTFSSVRRPKQSSVIWKMKGPSNTSNVDLSSDVGKLKAKGDIGVFVGYSKESAAFRIYNKRTRKIHESVNVNFDEISEMASKQFSLEPDLPNLNEMGKYSNPSVSQVLETSKKDLEDLFHNFYDEYFDASKIMKSLTTNVEYSNVEVP
nr:hypothetical protein [Tanacetum cinerariifolium]